MKRKIFICIGASLIIVLSYIFSYTTKELVGVDGMDKGEKIALPELVSGDEWEQGLAISSDEAGVGLRLQFATHGRAATGSMMLALKDGRTGIRLFETNVDFTNIKDNQEVTFLFAEPIALQGREPVLEINSVEGVEGSSVSLYGYHDGTISFAILYDTFDLKRMGYLTTSFLALYLYMLFVFQSIRGD